MNLVPPPLPAIERLSPLVVRVLGLNPGPYTLTGTNTYLVGAGKDRILIDTGEGGQPEYLSNLERAMLDTGCSSISHLVLTHYHHDHVGGVREVVERFGRPRGGVYKFPLTTGAGGVVASTSASNSNSNVGGRVETDGEDDDDDGSGGGDDDAGADARGECGGVAFAALADGDELSADTSATLRVLHTPGHTADHVALVLVEEGAVFSGDCVLGVGTAVFQDLGAYMASLSKMLAATAGDAGGSSTGSGSSSSSSSGGQSSSETRIYPGHGPVVEDGRARIQQYVAHRMARERQIVAVLRARRDAGGGGGGGGPAGGATAMDVVREIYRETPEALWPAAAANVGHHLKKLLREGRVRATGAETWELTAHADAGRL